MVRILNTDWLKIVKSTLIGFQQMLANGGIALYSLASDCAFLVNYCCTRVKFKMIVKFTLKMLQSYKNCILNLRSPTKLKMIFLKKLKLDWLIV